MGTQTGSGPSSLGPFGAILDSYFSALQGFGQTSQSINPAFDPQAFGAQATAPFKAVARLQLEVLGLANRRAQAYLQIPALIAHCRTPQDFMNEQMAFWRTAVEQYTECSRKASEAWMQAMPWLGAYAAQRAHASHDYINFNGAGREPLPSAPARTDSKQRRVA